MSTCSNGGMIHDDDKWLSGWARSNFVSTEQHLINQQISELLPTLEAPPIILHIGIGNSSFAEKFSSQCELIIGISPGQPEIDTALDLIKGLRWNGEPTIPVSNYIPVLCNKYADDFYDRIKELVDHVDIIHDSVESRYRCCDEHQYMYRAAAKKLLRTGGYNLYQNLDFSGPTNALPALPIEE